MTAETLQFLPALESPGGPFVLASAAYTGDPRHVRTRPATPDLAMTYWMGGPGFKKAMLVELEPVAGDGYVCSQPDTGIFGSGDSQSEAISDLRSALGEFRDALRASAPLGESLRHQLDVLEDHLEPPR